MNRHNEGLRLLREKGALFFFGRPSVNPRQAAAPNDPPAAG
jgi:hypothetical protein